MILAKRLTIGWRIRVAPVPNRPMKTRITCEVA